MITASYRTSPSGQLQEISAESSFPSEPRLKSNCEREYPVCKKLTPASVNMNGTGI